jgi:hypothetical protein
MPNLIIREPMHDQVNGIQLECTTAMVAQADVADLMYF